MLSSSDSTRICRSWLRALLFRSHPVFPVNSTSSRYNPSQTLRHLSRDPGAWSLLDRRRPPGGESGDRASPPTRSSSRRRRARLHKLPSSYYVLVGCQTRKPHVTEVRLDDWLGRLGYAEEKAVLHRRGKDVAETHPYALEIKALL